MKRFSIAAFELILSYMQLTGLLFLLLGAFTPSLLEQEISTVYILCHVKDKAPIVVSKSLGSYQEVLPEPDPSSYTAALFTDSVTSKSNTATKRHIFFPIFEVALN